MVRPIAIANDIAFTEREEMAEIKTIRELNKRTEQEFKELLESKPAYKDYRDLERKITQLKRESEKLEEEYNSNMLSGKVDKAIECKEERERNRRALEVSEDIINKINLSEIINDDEFVKVGDKYMNAKNQIERKYLDEIYSKMEDALNLINAFVDEESTLSIFAERINKDIGRFSRRSLAIVPIDSPFKAVRFELRFAINHRNW